MFIVASLNSSGYVREKALRYFLSLKSIDALPYVILRLNDWVHQVREQASIVFSAILPLVPLEEFIKYYYLFDRLAKTKYGRSDLIKKYLFDYLSDISKQHELVKINDNLSFKERLFCYKILEEILVKNIDLIEKIVNDPEPEIRKIAIKNIYECDYLKEKFITLLSDQSVKVRYAALKIIKHEDYSKYQIFFERDIFNDSKSIRVYARFMIKSNGENNFSNKYRARISDMGDQLSPGLIAGLAEVGNKKDIPFISKLINHKRPKIRAAAIYGLTVLNADNMDDIYLAGLSDNNSSVRNICKNVLRKNYSYLRPQIEVLLDNKDTRIRKDAFEVLQNYGISDSLADILYILSKNNNDELNNIAWQNLSSWHIKYSTKLWFNFSDDNYTKIVSLLNIIKSKDIDPPNYASHALQDLPKILQLLKDK